MRSSSKLWVALLSISLSFPLVSLTLPHSAYADDPSISKDEQTLKQVYELLRDVHWKQVDETSLLRGAVQGMINSANDPYTTYFTADEYQQFINTVNQNYAGVGIRLAQDGQGFRIDQVYSSSPAEAAGLRSGDYLLSIDNHDLQNQPLAQAAEWVRGKTGSTVSLRIRRAGQAPFSVTLTRQTIQLPSLVSNQLDDKTGYIRILSFSDTVGQEFDQALASLQQQGIQSLILDLRGNGGGVVESALHIADRFLKSGLLMHTEEVGHQVNVYADAEGVDLPLVILIDGDTASASEILAGALQANKRAKLVGTRSFGKGVFQSGIPLPNGDFLKMTLGQFYFADGSSPQKVGLTPDVAVATAGLQLPAAEELLHPEQKKNVAYTFSTGQILVNHQDTAGPKPFVENGIRYLPLRFNLEALGAEVKWNADDGSIAVDYGGSHVQVQPQSGVVSLNGTALSVKNPYLVKDNETYLSLDALKLILTSAQFQTTDDQVSITGN